MHHATLKIIIFSLSLYSLQIEAKDIIPAPAADPHYIEVGFFDIHVCNWPNKKLFFMTLFSTYNASTIAKIELYTPDNTRLGEINTEKYKLIVQKGKPEKRVFISKIPIPSEAKNGWYRSIITTKNGQRYEAKDYVILANMGIATGMKPTANTVLKGIPKKLTWSPVPGAKNYKVFIKDYWSKTTIYESRLLTKPLLVLPKGLIKKRSDYEWRIHARDVNENVLLGDFNHGSLNMPSTFSTN